MLVKYGYRIYVIRNTDQSKIMHIYANHKGDLNDFEIAVRDKGLYIREAEDSDFITLVY